MLHAHVRGSHVVKCAYNDGENIYDWRKLSVLSRHYFSLSSSKLFFKKCFINKKWCFSWWGEKQYSKILIKFCVKTILVIGSLMGKSEHHAWSYNWLRSFQLNCLIFVVDPIIFYVYILPTCLHCLIIWLIIYLHPPFVINSWQKGGDRAEGWH